MSDMQFKAVNLKKVIKCILIALIPSAVGFISMRITGDDVKMYDAMIKPPLAPPPALFGIIWPILYVLMGISLCIVIKKGTDRTMVKDAVIFFAIQLALNFLWPILFFSLSMPFLSVIVEIALWLFVGITTAKFYRINHVAGWLMVPYWLWVTFAAYLNIALWLLNR